MIRLFKVQVPIYQGYLRVVICDDYVEAAKVMGVNDEGKSLNNFGAFVVTTRSKAGIPFFNVFLRQDIAHDLLAHEVVHLVNEIYIECDIKLDPHNDEPQAYLTGWITKQVYRALNR